MNVCPPVGDVNTTRSEDVKEVKRGIILKRTYTRNTFIERQTDAAGIKPAYPSVCVRCV